METLLGNAAVVTAVLLSFFLALLIGPGLMLLALRLTRRRLERKHRGVSAPAVTELRVLANGPRQASGM